MAKKRKVASKNAAEPAETAESIRKLIEPFTKDQLVAILQDIATNDSEFLNKIREMAEKDTAHRKIFVHGLSPETSSEDLRSVFSKYGALEECAVVAGKPAGKCRGYGFITYKTMTEANRAMKERTKVINNRTAYVQLASEGAAPQSARNTKIYVAPVSADLSAESLRQFFSKFGELEEGPLGFDKETGRSKGYALFVYRTVEGAKKALEDPNKVIDGHSVYCKFAQDNSKKNATDVNNKSLPSATVGGLGSVFPYNPAANLAVLGAQNPAVYGAGMMGFYGAQATGLQLGPYQAGISGQYNLSSVPQTGTASMGAMNSYLRH
eukprot:TRINITY_DN31239_c0_g1_i1.p1 TRINITY_DN31239_c0_g1~~TRINITY_DN31239_c0_g1_i1.p1  ORF type:complete len:349 (-),score=16.20 TRINITY_DN31239_c0_g1_i1:186-1154(-)